MATKAKAQAAAPIYPIVAAEGIEVAMWKLMMDHQGRLTTEIADALAPYGFEKKLVVRRAVAWMKKNWFTRRETNHGTKYYLKKGVAMPTPDNKQQNTPAPTVVTETPNNGEQAKAAVLAAAQPVVATQQAAQSTVDEIIPEGYRKGPPIPRAEDGLATCIWKVMCDKETYSAREVAEYLEVLGINVNTTLGKMSRLAKEDWFIIGEKTEGGRKIPTYTLKLTVDIPTNDKPYKPNPKISEAAIQRHRAKELEASETFNEDEIVMAAKELQTALKAAIVYNFGDLKSKFEGLFNCTLNESGAKVLLDIMTARGVLTPVATSPGQQDSVHILGTYMLNKPTDNVEETVEKEEPCAAAGATLEDGQGVDQLKVDDTISGTTESDYPTRIKIVESVGGLHGFFGARHNDKRPELLKSEVTVRGITLTVQEARCLTSTLFAMGIGHRMGGSMSLLRASVLTVDFKIKGEVFTKEELEQLAGELMAGGFYG